MRKGCGVDRLGGPISIDKGQAGGSERQLGNELQDSTRFRHEGVGAWRAEQEHHPQSSRQHPLKVKKINLFSL